VIIPHIYIEGAAAAIEFCRQAFGAIELFRVEQPSGKILHVEISIAESVIMLGDPGERLHADPPQAGTLYCWPTYPRR
jgi:PhnB protein